MAIDWRAIGFGALWVAGLSLNLAVFSLADFKRAQQGIAWREVLGSRGQLVAMNVGWALFCFGLLGSARSIWEGGFWSLGGVLFLGIALRAAARR